MTKYQKRAVEVVLYRAPWALEEAIIDQQIQRWNRLYSTGTMFRYLRKRFGASEAVLTRLRACIAAVQSRYIWPKTPREQKEYVLSEHLGVVELFCLECLIIDSLVLLKVPSRGVKFLVERMGGKEALRILRAFARFAPGRSVVLLADARSAL